MSAERLDITDALNWEEGLPRPQWDLIEPWVQTHPDPGDQWDARTEALRQWLAHLAEALGPLYGTAELENFLILAPKEDSTPESLAGFAVHCQERLLAVLTGVASFDAPGKQVVVAIREPEDYYRYVSVFYPEGEHGGSQGLHIREGYPHVVAHGKNLWMLENTVAHELTHVALHLRSMPQWLEEGFAQMIEHDMTGRGLIEVNQEMSAKHKRYWGKHGLDEFWRGEGFSRAGKVQELSYQLAEILVRLMVEDARPRWFGLVREPLHRFTAFLNEVSAADCGQQAARECLGYELSDLAARFLGPGEWNPSL